jgi:hypothetical protein
MITIQLSTLVLLGTGYLIVLFAWEHMPCRRDVLRWLAGRPRIQLDGPRPGDSEHEHYMRELEHATIRPLGFNPWHCVDCMGYETTQHTPTREVAA